ncbi:MAG: signal peptidase I, partial [Alistipes sp.]|nr:signal peptidase I [Alistipes sp.]
MKLKEKILQNKYVVMLKEFFGNKWVKFALATIVYVLWFVVWTGNLWLLPGIIVIYDLYISKYFYKYVWSKNEKLCEISSLYRNIYEWGNAIVFATVVATLIHIFFFQMYVIPSSSMEKSLLVGDYLYVSKVTYGPQMPNTPVAFPFVHHTMPFSQTKKSFSEAIKLPYKRLKGLRQIERNDVVVFNFPAGDTVLVENQAVTYYDVLRDYQEQYGKQKGRELLEKQYNIVYRPVDKRENYIKRCVALPGDSIKIVDGELFINGKVQDKVVEKQYCYSINTSEPLSQYAIDELGITEI